MGTTERTMQALLDALPIGALVLDESGRVVAAGAALAASGIDAGTCVGRNVADVLPDPSGAERVLRELREPEGGPAGGGSGAERSRRAGPVRLRRLTVGDRRLALATLGGGAPEAALAHVRAELGRIRHEISNLLMGLLGCAELLEGYPELGERSRRRVGTILEEARRIQELLEELGRLRRVGAD